MAEIEDEKELVRTSALQAMSKSKYGAITQQGLTTALEKNKPNDLTLDVIDYLPNFIVEFVGKDRYYLVDQDGKVTEFKVERDSKPGDISTDKNGNPVEEGTYEIWCIEDLVAFRNMSSGNGIIINDQGEQVEVTSQTKTNFSGKTVKLMTDLDFKSSLSYTNAKRTDYGDINGDAEDGNALITEMTTGTGFNPINIFTGDFDGCGHELKNIYIDAVGDAGLFASNSCVVNEIKNLTISGEIKGTGQAAGILGSSNIRGGVLIENCCNKANVTSGNGAAAGIAGFAIRVKNCHNEGNITGTGGLTGGICAQFNDVIENCYNTGTIIGGNNTSGIGSGYGRSGLDTIKNCYNTGNISRKYKCCRNCCLF